MTQKILIIKLGALGDFVLSTGLMKGVRLQFPDAHITLMTASSLVSLAKQSALFDDIIMNDRKHFDIFQNIRIIKTILTDIRWDYIFDFQNATVTSKRYYPIARFLTKHPMMWVKTFRSGGAFYTPAKWPFTYKKPQNIPFEIKHQESSLDFCKGSEKNFHLLPEKYVLIIPGCSPKHPYKRWPKEKYAQLVKKLAQRNISSVILGTTIEEEEVNFIAQSSSMAVNFLNKAELLDIPQLAKKALCVVGNDTGPMHMASLVGTKAIVLFGEQTRNSARTAKNVINVFGKDIADISVDEVQQHINNLNKSISF